MPTATLAMFSKLKYVNAPNFEQFRHAWNAKYLDGFIVHSKAFEGLKGDFPIGFLIWKTDVNSNRRTSITEIVTETLDKKATPIGEKRFFNLPNDTFLNVWMRRPKANSQEVIPLKNSISPFTGKVRVKNWSDGAIAYMYCGVNDLQHANQQTVLYSSPYGGGNGFYLTPDNLWQAAIVFSVRRLIKPTWINDRDQFLQPTAPLTDEFKNDCLIWMLFNGSNLSASADDLAWNGKKWSIVNHFIPYTETDVGATGRFESDFMVRYLADKKLSPEAVAVLDAGRDLWAAYFMTDHPHTVRDEFKLNRPDVGWYQIRNALKKYNESGDGKTVDFTAFELAYRALTDKLIPMVYDLGFLRA